MDGHNGIDSKPRLRSRTRRRPNERTSSMIADHGDDGIDDNETDQILNVRVKERESDTGRKSRLAGIFKEAPTSAIKGLFQKETGQEIKETIKRPLTGLFRRPGSRAGSATSAKREARVENEPNNAEALTSPSHHQVSERAASPEIPLLERQVIHDSISKAPNIGVHRVPAMYQIDAMNSKNAYLAKLDDLDLSLLSRYLCAEDEIKDEEVVWTWDYVFTSISTEMREEWALDDEQDDDNYERRHPQ